MYIPDIFKNEDANAIKDFIDANAFGILISNASGRLWATHIPMEYAKNAAGKDILHAHISAENDQWKDIEGQEVLAVFSGPNAYISSSWYDHENVPTWNYTTVHVYGKVKIVSGDKKTEHLKILVDKYESESINPVRIEDLSQKTMLQTRGIVVFEIEITQIQAKRKLSQNRDDANHQNIVSELEKKDLPSATAIASEMRRCRKP